MSMDLRLHQKMELGLRLAPQMIQSIELLQLQSMDLEAAIEKELDINEFLERAETTSDQVVDNSNERDREAAEEERLERLDIWDDPETRRRPASQVGETDGKLEAMLNTADAAPSLQQRLLEQYALLGVDARFDELAEAIIGNVNEDGFLSGPLEEILQPVSDRFTPEESERILAYVQSLEPRGIAARSRAECLLLQIRNEDPDAELLRHLVAEHMDQLDRNLVGKIAQAMKLQVTEVERLARGLERYSLHPARGLGGGVNHYIRPDVLVEWNGSGYDVKLSDDWLPELRLSNAWRLALQSPDTTPEYREYVTKKVEAARSFIIAVQRRKQTLLDVASALVRRQRDYFDHGPHYIHPLKMQYVATELSIHVSTVSRASSEKYIQSHRGLIAMKDLFVGAAKSTTGDSSKSRDTVLVKLKEIVAAEDPQQPLDDDALVLKLQRDHGVVVARRTVTKYRKSLGIPSSHRRKRHGTVP